MSNIFKKLGDSFGTEDFFTASLALFIERNERFRNAFLAWLEQACGENLRSLAWQVEIQSASPSCAGEAVLDMKLRNPVMELWFEHKVNSLVGKRKTTQGQDIDQIEKYLDAAARVMSGVDIGRDDVDWPLAGPVEQRPRILLFYVSRHGVVPSRTRYEGKLHSVGGFGLVWPLTGALRWKEFWRSANLALEPVLSGESSDFECTLTKQFLNYWQSLGGMWEQTAFDQDWQELLTRGEEGRYGFETLWSEIHTIATEKLAWAYKQGYQGGWCCYSLATSVADLVGIQPIKSRDQLLIDTHGLENEILEVQIRFRDTSYKLPPAGTQLYFERWRGVTGVGRTGKQHFLRVYVGVSGWKAAATHEQRLRVLSGAFIAALKMFEQTTQLTLPGLDQI